ncbi:flagellar assembly protein FliW [Paenibacillus sp. KN14-4R]|uniref:flagellar assembly protein FliW n=1 Tax=Paenibacillus sp. KN14-4R TaxID=3445773 RepID=UPI003F9EEC3B
MLTIETIHFGEMNITEERMIEFSHGLPGFEELTNFIVVVPDESLPFAYLQSADSAEVSFLMADPFQFYGEYEFELSEAAQAELEVSGPMDVQVRVIVTVQESLQSATINLLAPIIINPVRRKGKQIVLHQTSYTTKHPLIQAASDTKSPTKVGESTC